MRLDNVTVTLVGPEFPVNVGYVARLVKNFGVRKLYLIAPRFDPRVASVYAAHGADVLAEAEETDFETLRGRHDLLVGTTAVSAFRRANVVRQSVSPEEVAGYVSASKSASLVFGRDTTGLRNEELARCDLVTTIGTGTEYRTLNLSHSLGILLYVLSRTSRERRQLPDLGERRAFVASVYELAVATGLERERAERLRKLAARMALRSRLDGREIGLLVSLMRKANVSITKSSGQERSKT